MHHSHLKNGNVRQRQYRRRPLGNLWYNRRDVTAGSVTMHNTRQYLTRPFLIKRNNKWRFFSLKSLNRVWALQLSCFEFENQSCEISALNGATEMTASDDFLSFLWWETRFPISIFGRRWIKTSCLTETTSASNGRTNIWPICPSAVAQLLSCHFTILGVRNRSLQFADDLH